MKKITMSVLLLLSLLAIFCLTACGSNQDNTTAGTSAAQTTQSTTGSKKESTGSTSSSTSGSNKTDDGNGSHNQASSPGVIEGLIDDVEDRGRRPDW